MTSQAITQPHSNPYTLIVADIHLQPENSHPINRAFIDFLTTEAPQADALYILGDLFEMWVGDDIGFEQYPDIIELLSKLSKNGLSIYLQYGNRDFLMRQSFFDRTGIQLLDDIVEVNLYGSEYLMLHGDTLCTDDQGYQKMRRLFRNGFIQFLFFLLPRSTRLKIGNNMRQKSSDLSSKKQANIMDVSPSAVLQLFAQHPNVKQMIHGHTHRPKQHLLEENNSQRYRWVLGDWRPEAKIIKVTEQGPEFIDIG